MWVLAKVQKFIPHSPTSPAVLLLPCFCFPPLFLLRKSAEHHGLEPRPWPPGGGISVDVEGRLELDEALLVDSPLTVRLILSIVVSRGWSLRQVDVTNAVVHGILQEVHMHQPLGYSDTRYSNHICRLEKAIYRLKEAQWAWYSRLSSKLQELGFVLSKADILIFIFNQHGVVLYLLIYVDDLIIASSSQSASNELLAQLQHEFVVKDLGSLHYFLGIEVCTGHDGLILSKKKICPRASPSS